MSDRSSLNRLGWVFLVALALFQPALVQAKVTKMVLTAVQPDYRGDCPAVIKFNGTITVDAPGTVKYIFTRSDGATDTIVKTLAFSSAGTKAVTETWTLGGSALHYYSGWEAIKTAGTPSQVSNQAAFKLRCNPPKDSAVAAHGDTDWHLDTANEFLFGKDMAGNVTEWGCATQED